MVYEINYRWKRIIKPGLNIENKKTINYLINLLLNCKYLDAKDKNKLRNYLKEIKNI